MKIVGKYMRIWILFFLIGTSVFARVQKDQACSNPYLLIVDSDYNHQLFNHSNGWRSMVAGASTLEPGSGKRLRRRGKGAFELMMYMTSARIGVDEQALKIYS